MNSGAGGPGGASGSGGAGGFGGTGGNADGTGVKGTGPTVPELTGCTYATFIKCDPLPFNETEGAVGLCQWFERLELVFQIRESSTARDPHFVGGLAPWALMRDLEALRRHDGAGGSGGVSGSGGTGGNVDGTGVRGTGLTVPELTGCTYATFINCDPLPFNGTKVVVGLCQWFERLESVFQISECKEKDRVKFAMATLRGRALTWWNGRTKANRSC
nr:putative reverse transcriptase domain-containing protein [Tanacetum cinerariifolium]